MSAYGTDLMLDVDLYAAHLRFVATEEYALLSKEQRRIIDETIKDFQLAGVGLPAEKKQRLKELSDEATTLGSAFNNNLLAAQDAWEKIVTDEALLAGIPEGDKAAMRESAKAKGYEGWRITLAQPVVAAVLIHADSRALREELYHANVTKASEVGPNANT